LEKGRVLRLHALRYMRKIRSALSEVERAKLPPIVQDDIDRLLVFAREVPIPLLKK
jgi:hypothetical protein